MSAPSDAALVEAWQAGDRKAGAELFERHYDGIVRFFRNKVGDGVGADLVQKTFLACVEGFTQFRGEASYRSYLFSIAYRLLCKHFEAQRRNRIDLASISAHDLGHTPSEVLAALRRIPIEYQGVWPEKTITLDTREGAVVDVAVLPDGRMWVAMNVNLPKKAPQPRIALLLRPL